MPRPSSNNCTIGLRLERPGPLALHAYLDLVLLELRRLCVLQRDSQRCDLVVVGPTLQARMCRVSRLSLPMQSYNCLFALQRLKMRRRTGPSYASCTWSEGKTAKVILSS